MEARQHLRTPEHLDVSYFDGNDKPDYRVDNVYEEIRIDSSEINNSDNQAKANEEPCLEDHNYLGLIEITHKYMNIEKQGTEECQGSKPADSDNLDVEIIQNEVDNNALNRTKSQQPISTNQSPSYSCNNKVRYIVCSVLIIISAVVAAIWSTIFFGSRTYKNSTLNLDHTNDTYANINALDMCNGYNSSDRKRHILKTKVFNNFIKNINYQYKLAKNDNKEIKINLVNGSKVRLHYLNSSLLCLTQKALLIFNFDDGVFQQKIDFTNAINTDFGREKNIDVVAVLPTIISGEFLVLFEYSGISLVMHFSSSVQTIICSGNFSDITQHDGRVYALQHEKKCILVLEYLCGKWQVSNTIYLKVNGTILINRRVIVAKSVIFVIINYSLHKFAMNGTQIQKLGKRGSYIPQPADLKRPRLCDIDDDENALVADTRLKICTKNGAWEHFQMDKDARSATDCVFDSSGEHMWTAEYNCLIKYSKDKPVTHFIYLPRNLMNKYSSP